jgi:hypothetical protein
MAEFSSVTSVRELWTERYALTQVPAT